MSKTTDTKSKVATTNKAESDKAESEVVSFEVVAMNGKQKDLTFYNEQLINHTKAIQTYRDAGNLAILAIAHEFDSMDKDESYKSAGFQTVAEFGRVVFDYKPSTVSLYLRSARAFLTEDEDGKVKYKDNLPKLTVGQMIELLPLVEDDNPAKVIKGFVDGELNDRMSTKALRDAVNSIRAIPVKSKAGKAEKSTLEKADKLGDYNKDKLPKNTTPLEYALTNIDATLECYGNLVKSLADVEHSETLDTKVQAVLKSLTEIRAELTK